MAGAAPSGGAAAGPETTDAKERSKQLAQEGRESFWRAEYGAAIEAFSRAYELAPDPNLLFNISVAYEKQGDPDRALEYLERYAPSAPSQEAPALEAKRKELEEAIRAKSPEPEPEPEPETTAEAEGPQPAGMEEPVELEKREPLMSPLAWTFVGFGAAGLGVGVGFGASAQSLSRDGEGACSTTNGQLRCPDSAQADLDAARTRALVADVGFGVAIAGLIGTVTVIGIRASKRKKSKQARLRPNGSGLTLSF